ncbi:MAG: four helix bundle protein [Bacteroidia bacterium]
MTKEAYIQMMQERTQKQLLNVIALCELLPKKRAAWIIEDQLIRSAGSVGANYRAACRARSGKEFFAKISIVVEEADEVCFWLDTLNKTNFIENKDSILPILKEANELLAIVATARKSSQNSLK